MKKAWINSNPLSAHSTPSLIVCVLGHCFIIQYLCHFKLFNHLTGEGRVGCFYLFLSSWWHMAVINCFASYRLDSVTPQDRFYFDEANLYLRKLIPFYMGTMEAQTMATHSN